MAKNDKSNWLPLLAGLGLLGGGVYLWSRGGLSGDQGTDEYDLRLIELEKQKIAAFATMHERIYGADGNRIPEPDELTTLGVYAEAMKDEEEARKIRDQDRYVISITEFLKTLGAYVILPLVVGSIVVGGMVLYDRYKRPPSQRPPTDCPKCGVTLANPDVAMAHVVNDHEATTDAGAKAAAAELWAYQPYWTLSTTSIMGGAYQFAYQPVTSWSPAALAQNLQGMMYSYAMGIGTIGSLQALSTTLVYCMI